MKSYLIMQTRWGDSDEKKTILMGLRAPLPNNKKPSSFNGVFDKINKYLNHIPNDKKKVLILYSKL
jgi:hypothetical protein